MGIRISSMSSQTIDDMPPGLNEFVGDMDIIEVASPDSFDEGMVVASVTEPLLCPKCGSELVDFGPPEFVDSDLITEEVSCTECEFKWHNSYTAKYADSVFTIKVV